MITNNNDILAKIEDEIVKAEKQNAVLKEQLKEMGDGTDDLANLVIPEKATYRIGVSRYDRTIATDITFDKLAQTMKTQLPSGTADFAFEADNKKVWLRNDTDVRVLFKQHFARKEQFVKIVPVEPKDSDFKEIAALELPKDSGDDLIQMYFGLPKCDFYAVIQMPSSLQIAEGLAFIKAINPKQKGIHVIDSDGDTINVENELEWKYFMLDAKNAAEIGKFCTLISD